MTDPVKKVTVRNYVDGEKLRADITFSATNLSNAMMEQPALHLHYSELLAKATRQLNDLKVALEIAESKVYRALRDEYVSAKEKITEAMLDRHVAAHPTIVAIKKAINEAKQIEQIAKGAVDSFGQRKDMIVQLGAKDRVELQGELRTRIVAENEAMVAERGERILEKQRQMRGES